MEKYFFGTLLLLFFLCNNTVKAVNPNIGGIGGLALFDSVKQRPVIKALEHNAYYGANKLQPGDLILEIDKVPVKQLSYGEVLKLVQGTVGTKMSLKVLRYNGIEHYYEINRIRVTLDMNPKWWQIPDYKYYTFNKAIETVIKDLNTNGSISLDKTVDPLIPDRLYNSNIMLLESYESLFTKDNGKVSSWVCNLIQTDEQTKADGLYTLYAAKLGALYIPNTKFDKKFENTPNQKKIVLSVKETSVYSNYGLNISLVYNKEFNKDENKELWKVSMIVKKG